MNLLGAGTLVAVMGLGVLAASRLMPEEMEVLTYRQLTRDGRPKYGGVYSDGQLVYFNELINGKVVLASVPTMGGSTTLLPMTPATILGISTKRRSLLMGDMDSGLYEVQIGTFRGRQIPLPSGAEFSTATWDPSGHRIAACFAMSATIFEPGLQTPPRRVPLAGQGCLATWDNDGYRMRFAVYDSRSDSTQWWEIRKPGYPAKPIGRFTQNLLELNGTWTSDNQFFVFQAGARGQARIWVKDEFGKAGRPYQLTVDARGWRDPWIVPRTNTIVAIARQVQGQLLTLPVQGESPGGKSVLPGLSAYELDYSRDGQWVTYTLFPQHTIWRSRVDSSEAVQISPTGLEAHQPHWSPDGRRIAFKGKWSSKGAHWRLYLASRSGGDLVTPRPAGDDEGVPTWSPDGRSLV
jgi:hypothetical protein